MRTGIASTQTDTDRHGQTDTPRHMRASHARPAVFKKTDTLTSVLLLEELHQAAESGDDACVRPLNVAPRQRALEDEAVGGGEQWAVHLPPQPQARQLKRGRKDGRALLWSVLKVEPAVCVCCVLGVVSE